MVKIDGVEPGSRAQRLGILPGDLLVSMNGHEIDDILDYRFFETERELRLVLCREGNEFVVELAKPQYAALGLEFETYLMDAGTSACSALLTSFPRVCGRPCILRTMTTGLAFCLAIILHLPILMIGKFTGFFRCTSARLMFLYTPWIQRCGAK